MNAAFLLMTTAWLAAGQAPAPAPAPVPTVTTGAACCSSTSDPCCNESFGHRLRERMQHLRRNNGCGQTAQCCEAPKPAPQTCGNDCGTCGRERHARLNLNLNLGRGHNRGCDTCNAAPVTTASCDTCGNGGHQLLGRLRGMFQRNNECCDTCGSAAPAAPTAEPVAPPKKMPQSPAPKAVRIDTPVQAPIPQAAPAIESSAPAVVPSIDADNRNPF